MGKIINIETQAGDSIQWGEATLTPFLQTISLRAPSARSWFVWNRPTSLLVQSPGETDQILRIPDFTRRIIWTLGAASLAAVVILWIINHKYMENKNG
jgi:hypothetical protein